MSGVLGRRALSNKPYSIFLGQARGNPVFLCERKYHEFSYGDFTLNVQFYPYLRKEVTRGIYAYLECGIPENGVARVRCECGEDIFVAFSCKERMVCPSCSTKRSILFGEKVREIVKPLPHRHITFTIPKILRGYFRRNRKLLKLLIQSANYAIEHYFHEALGIEGGYTGGIFCIQSHGSLLNFHPHIHALVLSGILKAGKFYQPVRISSEVIAKLFRARLLSVLLEQEVITQELIDLLLSWNYNSGFNVHSKHRIDGSNGEAVEKIARYISRAAISVERVEFNSEDNPVIVYEKQKRSSSGKKATYSVLEFMALVAGHIPSPYETVTFYDGVYSSSYRGKENKEKAKTGEQKIETEELKGTAKANSTWARLIHKIFDDNPLTCPKCGKEMKIIAFCS